jgi:hypothetical protein
MRWVFFMVDLPSFPPQQDMNAAVTVAHPRRRQILDRISRPA